MTQATGILVILAFLAYSLLSIRRPMWAFSLLILMFPLEQLLQLSIPFFRTYGTFFNYYVGVILAIAACRRLLLGEANLREFFNTTLIAVCVLYAIGLASLGWTPGTEFAIGQVQWLGPYIIVSVFFGSLLPRRLEEFDEFRRVILIGGTAIALLILINPGLQFYGDRAMIFFGGKEKGNPLALAELGAILAVTAAVSRDRGLTGIKVALRIAALILGLGLALKSGTRGQVIAAVIIVGILYPSARRSEHLGQSILTILGLMLFGGAFLFTIQLFVGSDNIGRWSVASLLEGSGGRLFLVVSYFKAFLTTPAAWPLGFGTMAFREVVPEGGVAFVENLFMEALFELGLVGFVAMLIVVCNSLRHGIWMIRNAYDDSTRINATLLLGLWGLYFLIAAKSYNLWTGFTFFFLSVVMTKCALAAKREWDKDDEDEDVPELDPEELDEDDMLEYDDAPRPA